MNKNTELFASDPLKNHKLSCDPTLSESVNSHTELKFDVGFLFARLGEVLCSYVTKIPYQYSCQSIAKKLQ